MDNRTLLLSLARNILVLLAGLVVCALLVHWVSIPSEPKVYMSDLPPTDVGTGIAMFVIGTISVLITVILWSLWMANISYRAADRRYRAYNTYLIILPYVIMVILFLAFL